MSTTTRTAIAALVLALTLAGCSSTPAAEDAARPAPTSSAIKPAPIPESTETPEAEEESPYGNYTQEEFYLASLKDSWQGVEPTPDQQVAAGLLVCQMLADGTPKDQVRVVEGSGPAVDNDNSNIVQYAVQVYCPEHSG